MMKVLVCILTLLISETTQGKCSKDEIKEKIRSPSVDILISIADNSATPPYFTDLLESVAFKSAPCDFEQHSRLAYPHGECNNEKNPFFGASLDVHQRLFTHAYLDDRAFPRIQSDSGSYLPSAIRVSQECLYNGNDQYPAFGDGSTSTLMEVFSKFLIQDISYIAETEGKNCCQNPCNDNVCRNADIYTNDYGSGGCFPIAIPERHSVDGISCINFTRSYAIRNRGVREQVNGETSFIDASNVYGASKIHQEQLRLGVFGLLKTPFDQQLPVLSDSLPFNPHQGQDYLSDFLRVLFQLEHNRIARRLSRINKGWTENSMYKETKQIVAAIMQKIVYEDYLPLLVGSDVMQIFHLDGNYVHDETINPAAILEFTTAAARYTRINTDDEVASLKRRYDHAIINDTNHISFVLSTLAKSEGIDTSYEVPDIASDTRARQIQRGRDHGLPPYILVRDTCRDLLAGVPGIKQDVPSCLSDGLYRSEEDIDLFAGGILEKPLEDGRLGPTFACVAGFQFQRLKYGDRLFYEGEQNFSEGKREFIRRTTLASLICELATEELLIPRDAFRSVSDSNPLVRCNDIREERNLDQGLEHWRLPQYAAPIRQRFVSFDKPNPCPSENIC